MITTPSEPGPPVLLQQAEIQLFTALRHAGAQGLGTSEFWVAVLTKPLTFIVTWLLAFLVTHSVVSNALAVTIAPTIASSVATAAAGLAAKAYIEGRSALKAAMLHAIPQVMQARAAAALAPPDAGAPQPAGG